MSDTKKDKKGIVPKKTETNLHSSFRGFFKNEHHTFSVLKAEKLASALYLITGFVPENDPLRTRLRTCALDLVSCVTDVQKAREGSGESAFGSRCLEIGSMLNMAERAGLISPMNAKVLCDEYAALGSFVQKNGEQVFGGGGIDVSAPMPETYSALGVRQGQSVSNSRKKTSLNDSKKTNNYKRHQNRRESILSLLDKKDKITVKDASNAVSGCSEKTMQRELISMVEEGVLLKEGERRWSTYKKAS